MTKLQLAERASLLRLARASIEEALSGSGVLARARNGAVVTPALGENRGAFVTLHETPRGSAGGRPQLRGCIGTLEPEEPLFECVIRNAALAAIDDPRFPRLAARELLRIRIEISALTVPRPIQGPADVVVGRDGIEMQHGALRSVFLPQVAVEHRWNTAEMLAHLARKAGIAAADVSKAQLRVFEAEVFGEGAS